MSKSQAEALVQRLLRVNWNPSGFGRRASRAALMQEYLRRSALWAVECGTTHTSPFFDATYMLFGREIAEADLLEGLDRELSAFDAGYYGRIIASAAVNFAAARDLGLPLPDLPDLYEPLILMFERGGDFDTEGARTVDVDTIGVSLGDHAHRMSLPKITSLANEHLDEIDSRHASARP